MRGGNGAGTGRFSRNGEETAGDEIQEWDKNEAELTPDGFSRRDKPGNAHSSSSELPTNPSDPSIPPSLDLLRWKIPFKGVAERGWLQPGSHPVPLPDPPSQVPTPTAGDSSSPEVEMAPPALLTGGVDGDREWSSPGAAGTGEERERRDLGGAQHSLGCVWRGEGSGSSL